MVAGHKKYVFPSETIVFKGKGILISGVWAFAIVFANFNSVMRFVTPHEKENAHKD